MKTIIVTILCSLIMIFANAQETKTYYDNGTLKEIDIYKNGKITSYKKYGKKGQLFESYTPISNKRYIFKYYDFGVLLAEVTYNNLKIKEGEMKLYYNTGELKAIMNNTNNLLDGTCTYFLKNGRIRTIENFKNGIEEGIWKTYFENETLKSICNYKQGKKSGEYKKYAKSGQLEIVGNYKYGEEIGEWKYYYDNGQMRVETKDENANVCEIKYYENKKLVKTITIPKHN